ncbi:hypothetical protein BLA9940_01948 [Burkholderia aenigmatica]|uniref:hypothetical protein n=1 Tax=Burkholderia aenigmatica TaxID=2015348 RepID=UPI001452C323|nr:hypothetical protein [Burkholderia aenigmatica]VWC53370.1 hypothetical protein BLA9940_01948 [Burkholderia aenigmatica]
MAYIQCIKCGAASASVFTKGELRKSFGEQSAVAGFIPPQIQAAFLSALVALIRDGIAWWRDRQQPYGVCSACGHIWKID